MVFMTEIARGQVEVYFYLTPVMGHEIGRYAITDKPQVVGRSERANIVLREPTVSRQHGRVELRDGAVYVEDLGSKHGTFVNSRRVQRTRLKPGDLVVFGLAVVLRLEQTSEKPLEPASLSDGVQPMIADEPSMTLTDLLQRMPISSADVSDMEELAPVRDHALKLTRLGGLTLGLLPKIYGQLSRLANVIESREPDRETIGTLVNTLLATATQLLEVASRISPEPREPVSLDRVVEQAIERVQQDFARRQLKAASRVPPKLEVRIDPEQMTAVLAGLLTNAGNQSLDGTPVEVVARRDPTGVVLKVIDKGFGYPEAILSQAFNPLGSELADPAAIRLWEARRAVVALGGMLTVKSTEGVGAVVRIVLPLDHD